MIPLQGKCPKELKAVLEDIFVHPCHSSSIHNSPGRRNPPRVQSRMNGEKMWYTHTMVYHSAFAWRIPGMAEPGGLPPEGSQSWTRLKRLSSSSRKEGNPVTCYNMNEPWGRYAKGKNLVTEKQYNITLLMMYLKLSYSQEQDGRYRGWWGGKMSCLMRKELQNKKMWKSIP